MRPALKRLLFFGGLGTAAAGFFLKARFFSRLLEQSTSDDVLFHVDTKQKVVALTIDDAPHPELTADILDVLAEYAVPATFFIIGDQVAGNEELMRRIGREGHELGNHLMHDERSILLGADEFNRQLLAAHALIRPFGPVRWFRPGSGFYNERMLAQIRPFGYRCVLGSIYPYDAHLQSVDFASSYILGNTQRGAIIILHDGGPARAATPEILRRIVPALRKRRYRFLTLSQLTQLEGD
jgi:peptidoglycan/xylan/chitin deacetylase (PgdA/CDA1 family)